MAGPPLGKIEVATDLDSAGGSSAPPALAVAGREQPARAGRQIGSRLRQVIPLAALSAVLTGEVMELRARGASQAAFDRLNRAYGAETERQAIKDAEVLQIVGRAADEFDTRTGTMVFRWRGALKSYALFVQYGQHMRTWYVRDFGLNKDPRSGASR